MNTNQLAEIAKAKLLTDGSMNWNFVPEIKGTSHPSMWKIMHAATSFAKLIFIVGEKDLAEKILCDLVNYLAKRAGWYKKNSNNWSGPAREYGSQWRTSAECCCPMQESVSGIAARLGLVNMSRYAVSVQCPGSPSGYYPNVSQSIVEVIGDDQRIAIEKQVEDLVAGKIDFFSW